jgi:GDP-D-glucose phosphorylase
MACVFSYKFKDLSIRSLRPETQKSENENNVNENEEESCCGENLLNEDRFDILLGKLWDLAQEKGIFRYKFKKLPSKVLPGKYHFFTQLNPDRAEKRREPQIIESLHQPFNELEFNFRKVKPQEILLQLKPWWSSPEEACGRNKADCIVPNPSESIKGPLPSSHDELLSDESDHKVLINASPFEYGNVLLVPFIHSNHPQLITRQGLRLALELLLLSRSRDFRVGFNSLCAYASVNHCHFHAYYLQHRLYLESAELKLLSGPCMEICDYPAPGFVFVLTELKDEEMLDGYISDIYKLVAFFQENNLPYNLYAMRGLTPNSSGSGQAEAIRLFLWARSPSFGNKVCDAFNPALCELGGHFPIKNESAYEKISEDAAAAELRSITEDVFARIRNQVVSLYSSSNL